MKSLKNFIRALQTSDEETKKRFVFISSAICLVFLVILWVFYLNLTLPNESKGTETQATLEQGSLVEAGSTHWSTFKKGLSVVVGKFQSEKNLLETYSKEIMDKINLIGENMNVSENQNVDIINGEVQNEFEPLFKQKEIPVSQDSETKPAISEPSTPAKTENLLFPTE